MNIVQTVCWEQAQGELTDFWEQVQGELTDCWEQDQGELVWMDDHQLHLLLGVGEWKWKQLVEAEVEAEDKNVYIVGKKENIPLEVDQQEQHNPLLVGLKQDVDISQLFVEMEDRQVVEEDRQVVEEDRQVVEEDRQVVEEDRQVVEEDNPKTKRQSTKRLKPINMKFNEYIQVHIREVGIQKAYFGYILCLIAMNQTENIPIRNNSVDQDNSWIIQVEKEEISNSSSKEISFVEFPISVVEQLREFHRQVIQIELDFLRYLHNNYECVS